MESPARGLAPIAPTSLALVLSKIVDIASETRELPDVFDRVATGVRGLIPFDGMAVVRAIDEDRVDLHSAAGPLRSAAMPLAAWSPRWRPGSGLRRRIDDARTELDPAFPVDAEAIEVGFVSAIWEPFRIGDRSTGGIWLCARAPHAFTDDHQEILKPIVAVLGSVVERWTIRRAEHGRRERLGRLESLLGSLAESLDVREVFERLSAELQTILPHHLMNLTEIDGRARTIRIVAYAGGCDIPMRTDPFPLTEKEVEDRVDFAIVRDIRSEITPDTERRKLILASGLRSWLHVPLWLSGEIKGSLSFLHREPGRYDGDDAEVALLVAARVALTLSHQKLAEEARLAAESRERAERLQATVETLARELEAQGRGRVVGISRSWKETLRQVGRVASADTTVLITGESGTGKEVVADLIHRGSPRAGKPFVAINCAALPEQLLESELFGHEKGAFTGAVATKIGRIEQAEGGTLFLDEIGELSSLVQAKFLRVLEEREFQRLGGSRTRKAEVRVIAATNRDLAASMRRQEFRQDLYYRLNVFPIHVAPLRERPEDIVPLAEVFLEELGPAMGRPAIGISDDAREWLHAYRWPGNVRELRNVIERAILLCDGETITRNHLLAPAHPGGHAAAGPASSSGPGAQSSARSMDLGSMERALIETALHESRGNKSKAARLLGLTRAQLYSRLEKHGIQ